MNTKMRMMDSKADCNVEIEGHKRANVGEQSNYGVVSRQDGRMSCKLKKRKIG